MHPMTSSYDVDHAQWQCETTFRLLSVASITAIYYHSTQKLTFNVTSVTLKYDFYQCLNKPCLFKVSRPIFDCLGLEASGLVNVAGQISVIIQIFLWIIKSLRLYSVSLACGTCLQQKVCELTETWLNTSCKPVWDYFTSKTGPTNLSHAGFW